MPPSSQQIQSLEAIFVSVLQIRAQGIGGADAQNRVVAAALRLNRFLYYIAGRKFAFHYKLTRHGKANGQTSGGPG